MRPGGTPHAVARSSYEPCEACPPCLIFFGPGVGMKGRSLPNLARKEPFDEIVLEDALM